ncbi:MAG: carboxypeptidase-like regulatory domain-containing protein [Actinobacteria bacterium]|nr:carboxypeptidase-like regulatory domain-containing protein [Actinomycetota bacterium]
MRTLAVCLIAVVVAACGSTADNSNGNGGTVERFSVSGVALSGPHCPVVQSPPDPQCADRPVANAEIVITNATGDRVDAVRTDADGRFTIALAAGDYTFTPQPVDGLMGTPSPQSATAGASAITLSFDYDTGIR